MKRLIVTSRVSINHHGNRGGHAGTLQTLGERGGKRMLIRHTCSTSLSPSMSPLRKLRPSLLQYLGTWSEADAGGIL